MFASLKDPIQVLAVILGIGVALETYLKPEYKARLAEFLRVLAERPIVPPSAIAVVDRIFGSRPISFRSVAAGAAVSIIGALLIALIIQASGWVDIFGDSRRLFEAAPLQFLAFVIIVVFFDVMSFLMTRVFVQIVSERASFARGIILFASDLVLSTIICIFGLAVASTAAVATMPDSFWQQEADPEYPEDALARILRGSDARLAIDPPTLRFVFDGPDSATLREQVRANGFISLSRDPDDPMLQIMHGTSPSIAIDLANANSETRHIARYTCEGPEGLAERDKQSLMTMLYGRNPAPECPLPVLYRTVNAPNLSGDKLDEVLIGMFSLYLRNVGSLLASKLNEYISIGLPSAWQDVIYQADWAGEEDWLTIRFRSRTTPNLATGYDYDYDYGDDDGGWVSYEDDLFLPITPLLGSALWMSICFYVFVLISIVALVFTWSSRLAKYLLTYFEWTKAPVGVTGTFLALALAVFVVVIEILF